MELINTGINWISWAAAAYVVGMTLFLVINIAIGAVKSKSALWWFLIYSVVVIGMMLAGLKYLPSLVLAYSNEGIEAAEPEMARFSQNLSRIFNTATGSSAPNPPTTNNQLPAASDQPPAASDQPPAASDQPPATNDPEAGGGIAPVPTATPPPPLPPQATPTLAATATPSDLDHRATADARLATVTAASQPSPTYDILKPPTPIIRSVP